jgi:hypothetical protein
VERRSHPVAIVVALVCATLAGAVAIASIWANDQLLDTGSWVSVSRNLLESKQVRGRVAEFLGEELASETESQLRSAGEDEIAARVMPGLRARQTELAERVMKTKQFGAIWEAANRQSHKALLRVLDDEGNESAVVVDLTPALRRVADQLGREGLARELGVANLGELVEPGAARIEVLEAEELKRAQEVVSVVRHLTAPAVIVALALFAVALILGRRRLGLTLVGCGLALAATGGLALLARALAGRAIVDELLGGAGADRGAADAAWRIATSKVSDLAGLAIGIGVVIVLLVAGFALVRKVMAEREPAY